MTKTGIVPDFEFVVRNVRSTQSSYPNTGVMFRYLYAKQIGSSVLYLTASENEQLQIIRF